LGKKIIFGLPLTVASILQDSALRINHLNRNGVKEDLVAQHLLPILKLGAMVRAI